MFGSSSYGQGAFGEYPLYEAKFSVAPATAVAQFITPTVQGSSTAAPPPGHAGASMPVPVVRVVVEPPTASATAQMLVTHVHGGTYRADVPTSLEVDARTTNLEVGRTTSLAISRATSLALQRTTTLELFSRVTTVQVGRTTVLILQALATELELEEPTTLVLEEHEGVLVLDG